MTSRKKCKISDASQRKPDLLSFEGKAIDFNLYCFLFSPFRFFILFKISNFVLDFLFTLTWHYLNMLTNSIFTKRQGLFIHTKPIFKMNETFIHCTFS